jgi:hypothetical protein
MVIFKFQRFQQVNAMNSYPRSLDNFGDSSLSFHYLILSFGDLTLSIINSNCITLVITK